MAATTKGGGPAVETGGRSRSPNFPAISLSEALKKIKTIYDQDGRGPVSAAVVLEHLGYGKNMSGSAGRVISALRQYGLLDDLPDDKYRVSEAAFHILTLSEESAVRKAAITRSGQKPQIFREVLAAYPDRLPSDSALRDYLIADKKFNPVSVDTFIRAFRSTVEFAYLAPGAYDRSGQEGGEVESATNVDNQGRSDGAMNYVFQGDGTAGAPQSGVLSLNVPSGGKGQLSVQIHVRGERLKRSHVAKVRRYLEIAEEDLDDGDAEKP